MSSVPYEPIDFVIIWVDGNDKEWRAEKDKYDDKPISTSNSEVRFRDWDNLQYWFRGVEKFAPWVRKIHFLLGVIYQNGLIPLIQSLIL